MDHDAIEPETMRLQLQKAIDVYQLYTTLLIQSMGFLVGADVILLSYSISARKSAPLLLAALMPLLMLMLRVQFGGTALAAAYVAMQLKSKLCPGIDSITTTLLASRFPGSHSVAAKALGEADQASRTAVLKSGMSGRNALGDPDMAILLLAFIAQSGLFAIGWLVFDLPFL